MPGSPRSSSLGIRIMTLLPFHGTFFFIRGDTASVEVRLGAGFDGVEGATGSPFGMFMLEASSGFVAPTGWLVEGVRSGNGETEGARSLAVVTSGGDALSFGDAMSDLLACLLARRDCLRVSVLDCFLRAPCDSWRCLLLRLLLRRRSALGVRRWSPSQAVSSSPENESLSEEFSLSPVPSLSQCSFSRSLP